MAWFVLMLPAAACMSSLEATADPPPGRDPRGPGRAGASGSPGTGGGGGRASVGDPPVTVPVVDAGAARDVARAADAAGGSAPVGDAGSGIPIADAGAPPPDPSDVIFDPTILHEITIEVAPQDLTPLTTDRTRRIACKVTFDGREVTMATAHRKGLSTGSSSKPSLVLDFDDLVAGQKLHGVDKLVLNNALQDPSFVNEHLAYEVYRMAGQAAPRTAHGLVTINGKAYGLYIIEEATDKQFLARWFGKAFKEGNLYEGSLHDFVADQTAGKWPNDLTLKKEVEDKRTRDDIIALATLVKTAPAAEYEARLSQKLDFTAFMTAFAIDMIMCTWDDYFYAGNNYYLYNNPRDSRFVLLPHSPDWLFSARPTFPTSRPEPNLDPFVPLASLKAGIGPGRMAARVREIPALEAKLRAEVGRVIRQVWDVARLRARIDRVETTLRTNKRTDAKVVSDIASFERQAPVMRDVLGKRKTYIETLVP